MSLFRRTRIAIAFYALVLVAGGAWIANERSVAWDRTLRVSVYPIAGDDSAATQGWIDGIADRSEFGDSPFVGIEDFFAREHARHGGTLPRPVAVALGPTVTTPPPAPPASGNPLLVVPWSLRLRWYSRSAPENDSTAPTVRIFVVYHDPQRRTSVPVSLGLRQGTVGVVHAFASRAMRGSNEVVIAHELLHTLGAADRYDPASSLPLYPDGYAEPERVPRYPQRRAEIMGGRVPLSPTQATVPRSLKKVVVGEQTAREIRWRE